ncbi:MAG: sporulation peptidase YabG [bacterium]|nr:sporulation peptidase YabG [bacterium]
MLFKIGDLVTRKSYNNDTIFKITSIDNDIVYLKGVEVRLYADSPASDLNLLKESLDLDSNDNFIVSQTNESLRLDRDSFFYLPGKIVHFDGDDEYLNRCMNFYKKMKVQAYGVKLNEEDIPKEINKYLEKLHPNIIVITGHDFFYKDSKDKKNIDNYRNSKYFVEAIKKAREYEKSQDKLIIIAGACQSYYEELIKEGANFASSPKRVNIHALDPAIIASSIALSTRDKPIDIIKILSKTKYKEEGMGGIITNGMMYTGYPR